MIEARGPQAAVMPDRGLARLHRATPLSGTGATGAAIAIALLVVPAFLYFGLFGILLLDELVLGTYYATTYLPQSGIDFLTTIYAPLIYFVALN